MRSEWAAEGQERRRIAAIPVSRLCSVTSFPVLTSLVCEQVPIACASGGSKSTLIKILAAFYRRPRILILDEGDCTAGS